MHATPLARLHGRLALVDSEANAAVGILRLPGEVEDALVALKEQLRVLSESDRALEKFTRTSRSNLETFRPPWSACAAHESTSYTNAGSLVLE